MVRATYPGWSVGYRVLEKREPTSAERARGAKRVIVKWEVFELSPVKVPAGVGTGTMEASCT